MRRADSILFWGRRFTGNYKLLSVLFFVSLLISIYFATPFFIMRGTVLTVVSVSLAVFAVSVRWQALKCVSENPLVLADAGGIYSLVRFPFYSADMLTVLALSLFAGVWNYFVLICPVAYLVFDRMILYREYIMQDKYGDAFAGWARRTTALFVLPNVIFRRSKNKVSRKFLFAGIAPLLFFLIFAFIVIDIFKTWRIELRFDFSCVTVVCLGVSAIFFLLSLAVKRY